MVQGCLPPAANSATPLSCGNVFRFANSAFSLRTPRMCMWSKFLCRSQVWNTSTCEFVRTLNGHKRGIACLQYRDGLVVSGSSDNTIRYVIGFKSSQCYPVATARFKPSTRVFCWRSCPLLTPMLTEKRKSYWIPNEQISRPFFCACNLSEIICCHSHQ